MIRPKAAFLMLLPLTLAGLLWLAAGAFASLYAARGAGLADQVATHSRSRPDQSPDQRRRSAPDRRLAEAEDAYARAVWLDPLDPDHRQGLARVIELRATRLPPGDPDARSALTKALVLYRGVARERPSWPYTWLAVARVQARLGVLDPDFVAILGRASRLGPRDPRLQGLLLELTLPLWNLLGPQAREIANDALVRGVLSQPREVLRIAVRAGRADLVTPLVAGDAAGEALLREYLRTQAAAPVPGSAPATGGGG